MAPHSGAACALGTDEHTLESYTFSGISIHTSTADDATPNGQFPAPKHSVVTTRKQPSETGARPEADSYGVRRRNHDFRCGASMD